jgi:hypothetical protein
MDEEEEDEEEESLGAWIYKQSCTAKLLLTRYCHHHYQLILNLLLESISPHIRWIQTWGYLFDLLYPRNLSLCARVVSNDFLFTVP